MTIKNVLALTILFFSIAASSKIDAQLKPDFIIANGQMPSIAKDKNNNLHIVFGNGDSIMYTFSANKGSTFSTPVLITRLPHVYTYATRGPQIAATDEGIIVTACTTEGNIYSFYKKGNTWKRGGKLNDQDTVCKEGLMALGTYNNHAFAVWLDLRGNKRNKIYGANSVDGGKTWSRNILIYSSPDSTVCECCKPSVVVWKNKIAVMFRNWLNGNRDLYLVQSNNYGNSFSKAEKLGTGSWKLNGCPMDGGSVAINNNGNIQTVWRRQAMVFSDVPGMPETEIGKGKNCTMEIAGDKNIYAWIEDDKIVVTYNGKKKFLGEGSQPNLKKIDDNHLICVWQNEKQIHASVLQL